MASGRGSTGSLALCCCCVAMAAMLGPLPQRASADPILAPDLKYCHIPLELPDEELPFDCCAPDWDQAALEFDFADYDMSVVKVRRPAHALTEEYAAKVDRAYGLMRALPDDDPRSFTQQANIHCAYCGATYQMGNSTTPLQVHASWLFYSFHRWYLFFHERILASLLGDPTFALPFWNYDHPDGMTIPAAYVSHANLSDRYRDPAHLPPATVMIDYYYMNASFRTADEQIQANLATAHRMIVSGAPTQFSFFGQPYRKDSPPEPGYGTTETMPHNSVHGWTGDTAQIGKKDMGTLYAAGRDPVFYTHHANIDRFWEVWKSLPGNADIDDPDYLASEFVFYNENAELVKVKIADSFNTTKLGYVYEDVENLWLDIGLERVSDGVASLSDSAQVCVAGEELAEPCSLAVGRDGASNAAEGEEMLVLEGIEGVLDAPTHFEVFINLPDAGVDTMTNCTEFVGRFSTLPQMVITDMTGNYHNTSVRFAIGSNLEELGLSEQETVVVTLVPRTHAPYATVSIASIRIYTETQGLRQTASARPRVVEYGAEKEQQQQHSLPRSVLLQQ